MNKTKIEWCDATFNPISGCLHGCEYCYARRIAERLHGINVPYENAEKYREDYGNKLTEKHLANGEEK